MGEKDTEDSNIVVASVEEQEYEQFLAPNLTDRTWDFVVDRVDPALGISALIEKLKEAEGQVLISCWETPELPEDLPTRVPTLKCICHICGAVRWFVPRALLQQGPVVTNWGNTISHSIAEHCLLQTLAALRHATFWQFSMHLRHGHRNPDRKIGGLFDKRVGLHGLGAIARELVKLIEPFNCKVSAYSPHVSDEVFEGCGVRRCRDLEELFSQNDVIVELAALTDANRGIVTERLLRLIPEGGAFVNSGRGKVVDEEGLLKVAAEGRIQFALDVFPEEPLPEDSPLCGNENVFMTPHIAGPTTDRYYLCGLQALRNAEAFFSGGDLQNKVSVEQYDRMT